MPTVLRFEDENKKTINKERVKQQKVIPVGTLLYTDSMNMPIALSKNTMLFTTDTRELYIGTGSGIARVNVGSDGEVIDKGDYLSKIEAAQIYVQKEYLDPSVVLTDQEMKDYVAPLQKTVEALIEDNEQKIYKEDVYNRTESDERFVDNEEFDAGMQTKIDQELRTNTGNIVTMKNLASGIALKFQNLGNDTEHLVTIGKDKIVLSSRKTKEEEYGGRIFITPAGVFYTFKDDEVYGKDDELIVQKDIEQIQTMYNELHDSNDEIRQIAIRSVESARQSELMVENMRNGILQTQGTSNEALELAAEARNVVDNIREQLEGAIDDSTSSIQKATEAQHTANVAKDESGETLTRLRQFESSVLEQLQNITSTLNSITEGTTTNVDDRLSIIAVQNFPITFEVPYNTKASELNLPSQVSVTLSDNTSTELSVSWQTSRYQPLQTNYSQQIVGTVVETGTIKNPNYLFAVYTVRVMPDQQSEIPEYANWNVTFAMPTMIDSVQGFKELIGHPELSSSDIMGTYDTQGNYVNPKVGIFLIGTLKQRSTSPTAIIIDPSEVNTLVNKSILEWQSGGLRVPIYGVATDTEISTYETKVLTRSFFACNGAVAYSNNVLEFDHAVDSNNVYVIKVLP